MRSFIAIISSFFYLQQALAQDCLGKVDYSLPVVGLDTKLNKDFNFWSLSTTPTSFCFNKKLFNARYDLDQKFLDLKKQKVFDENDCLDRDRLDEKNAVAATDLVLASLDSKNNPMKIYALSNAQSGELLKVVMSNNSEKEMASNALTSKDKWELAGITVASSALGIMIERRAFEGQKDKHLHANYGAVINIGTNLASYAVIEEMGVGDRFNLTKEQKKMAILLSGTIMGILVGYAKERFYDYYRPDRHTYDPHLKGDMGATMLGSGAMTPFFITFTKKW